jgi:predicted enzyme related to lactoylglutathione lyase
MAQSVVSAANRPAWVDLASPDPAASRSFYGALFGWQIQVNPDPQYGGYAMAKVGGADVAGIGPKMAPEGPTAWSIYIGTDDIEGLAGRVVNAGGRIVLAPMAVGDQGRMTVFADPVGAMVSAWEGQASLAHSAGRSLAPEGSTPPFPSTRRSSDGLRGRARWARVSARTRNSCSARRASPGRWR